MVRILRQFDRMQYKTLQRGNPPAQTFGQKFSGDAQVEGLMATAQQRVAAKRAYERHTIADSKVPR